MQKRISVTNSNCSQIVNQFYALDYRGDSRWVRFDKILSGKVQTFWKAQIIWKNLLHGFDAYKVISWFVKTMRKVFEFFLCFSVSPNFNYNRSLSPEDFSSLDFVPYRYTAVQPAWEVYKLCMKHYWTHLCWHRSVCNHKSQLLTQVRPCNNR